MQGAQKRDQNRPTRASRPVEWTITVPRSPVNRSLDLETIGRLRLLSSWITVRAFTAWVVLLLTACSPRYDWRDYQDADGFVATFPGKVQSASRAINLDGATVTMTLRAARVGETAFVVGTIALPGQDEAALKKAEDAVLVGLQQNLEAKILSETPISIARVEQRAPGIQARALEFLGTSDGHVLRMSARVAHEAGRVYQIVVVGPSDALKEPASQEATDTFLRSVRLP